MTMKAGFFPFQHGPLKVDQLPIPIPKADEVRIKVICCGICHGDLVCQHGSMGTKYPRVPGHEAVGYVDMVGDQVTNFQLGDYVGCGWSGGSCGTCDRCLLGEASRCSLSLVFGTTIDGGYAEYAVAKRNAFVKIPKQLKPEEAAPLLCAGMTCFNALRNSGATPGDIVVIQGIGGLGHLGVQYARKMGFHTVAVGRGTSKAEDIKKLGAHAYFDADAADFVQQLKAFGDVKVILSTVTSGKAVEKILPTLGFGGKCVLVGAIMEPLSINTLPMLMQRQSLVVWPAGTVKDIQDTINFSVLQDIKPVVEVFPLEKAVEAYDHAIQKGARFRAVIKVSDQ